MAKINRSSKRIIKFLIIIGIIVLADTILDITHVFNKSIQAMVVIIFNLKIDGDLQMYTSLYASIAVLWSSGLEIIKKLEYSISLVIIYAWIFTFVTAHTIIYPSHSLYSTTIVFITMAFPILLWILSSDGIMLIKDNTENEE